MAEFKYNGKSRKSGVYKITNSLNGRVYVGSTKEFKRRWSQHIKSLLDAKHFNRFLQNDFLKCGEAVFVFEVLEVVDGDRATRTIIEQKYLDEYMALGKDKCYNIRKQTTQTSGPWSYTPIESRQKSSDSHKGKKLTLEHRQRLSKIHKKLGSAPPSALGRKRTDETKRKMSDALKGNKNWAGKHHTFKTKRKLSELHQGMKHSEETKKKMRKIYHTNLVSPEGEIVRIIENINDFSEIRNLNRSHLVAVIRRKRKTHKGWKLLNEELS